MTGELSSRKSEQKVWVGIFDDDGPVVVFGSQAAAEEAVEKKAVDRVIEFPLYLWLPQPESHASLGTMVRPDGSRYEHTNVRRLSWPWGDDVEYEQYGGPPEVYTSGTNISRVVQSHEARVEALVQATKDKALGARPKEDSRVKTLAALLEASDTLESAGGTYESWARGLLATGQVEVTE